MGNDDNERRTLEKVLSSNINSLINPVYKSTHPLEIIKQTQSQFIELNSISPLFGGLKVFENINSHSLSLTFLYLITR